jgi:hypothetical protein
LPLQFLNCWWISSNKSVLRKEKAFLSITGMSLKGIIQE